MLRSCIRYLSKIEIFYVMDLKENTYITLTIYMRNMSIFI